MSYIGLVAHCAALAVQHDMDKANAADREVDETQVELAQSWLHGPLVKPDGMTDEEWAFYHGLEWTSEQIARVRRG